MHPITNAMVVPHPLIFLPNIGQGREAQAQPILDAYRAAAQKLIASQPETVVIVSPHAPSYFDYIQISSGKEGVGDLHAFGDSIDRFQIRYDTELIEEISAMCLQEDMPAGTLGKQDGLLDHGTMVPLYFLKDLPASTRFIRIGIGGVNARLHYQLGSIVQRAAAKLGRRVAIVGSGDLSHCQKEDGAYGFKACGPVYDENMMRVLKTGNFLALLSIPERDSDEAMVCGQKSFCVLAGALDGLAVMASEGAHAAPFGVGYGVVSYAPLGLDPLRHFLITANAQARADYEARVAREDDYVKLARTTINNEIEKNELTLPSMDLPEKLLKERAGVFVSIHENGRLRGCIGTTSPTRECVASEIVSNAIAAATRDPRFPAIQPWELESLEIHVDVLGPASRIDSSDSLDPKRYGVIVTKGNKRGLLLPDLEGVDTVEMQLSIAKQKAGLDPNEPDCVLERFEVERHI